METNVGNKVLKTIKKLQRLSENNTSGAEAELAAERALRLMREYAISQADVDAADAEREDPLVRMNIYLDGLKAIPYGEKETHVYKLAGWKRNLVFAVGHYLGIRASYFEGTAKMALYGHQSDCLATIHLYNVCARQIDRQCGAYMVDRKAKNIENGRYWANDSGTSRTAGFAFRESAVKGLEAKFASLTEESQMDHAEGHALVVTRKAKVSEWVDANYTFTVGKSGLGGNAGWSTAGFTAGKNLSLSADREISGSAAKSLPG